ncbi:MAG: PKD domain-containing protein, partial [Candidatus Thermoplasmatota archaeon]|nr:PKD domain-containing protein [Candidatus Thermoplasmatota archaeon]
YYVYHEWVLTVNETNRPPIMTYYYPSDNPIISEGDYQYFNITAYDPDGDNIYYTWSLDGVVVGYSDNNTFDANYESAGTYTVNITITDGEYYVYHEWVLTVNETNRPPKIISYYPKFDPIVNETESYTFIVSTEDPDNDQLTIDWYLNNSFVTIGESYTFITDYDSAGWYEVKVIVSDGDLSVEQVWILTVTNVNRASIVNSVTANPTTINPGGTAIITVDATDEDVGDTLTYHYDCTGGTISGTGSTVTWTAPDATGDYTITIYVNDGKVDSNSKSVTITVEKPEKKEEKGFIPGFEMIYLLAGIGVCMLLLKRKKAL